MTRPENCTRCARHEARAIVTTHYETRGTDALPGGTYSRQAMCWECSGRYTNTVLRNRDASRVEVNPIY